MGLGLLSPPHQHFPDLDNCNNMKRIFVVLIMLFFFSANILSQNNVGLPTQATADEYEAGRKVINGIIADNKLLKIVEGYAYAGYFIGEYWLIIKRGEESFDIFAGLRDKGINKTYHYDLSNKTLQSLFNWTNNKSSIGYNIRNEEYIPLYFYCILFDEHHIKKLEFNIYTMSAYKKAQPSKQWRKMLPFTKKQSEFIGKILVSE